MYRLPLLVLDATGMRVTESSCSFGATWTSFEPRLRIFQAKTKTKTARWVPVKPNLGGKPPVEAGSWLGQSAQERLKTYAHVMIDRTELDHAALLNQTDKPEQARTVARGWHA